MGFPKRHPRPETMHLMIGQNPVQSLLSREQGGTSGALEGGTQMFFASRQNTGST